MFKVVNQDGFNDLKYFGPIIASETIVYTLTGTIEPRPTQTSIQVGDDQHVEDIFGQYINHACQPTVKVVGSVLMSLCEIQSGDSITFDYNDSENSMSNPFVCHCCAECTSGGKTIAGKFKQQIK